MRLYQRLAGVALLGVVCQASAHAGEEDPYQWLEEVRGDASMAWVRQQNQATMKELDAKGAYQQLYQRIGKMFGAAKPLPAVTRHGKYLYNFLSDATHARGIWRRTSMEQYRREQPQWETVIDLDQLSAAENEAWSWHDVVCQRPAAARCLVMLSRGGGDAHEVREFDTVTRSFVQDGFRLPHAKSKVAWAGQDTILVATDFGADSMTASGYPRIVKEWQRNTPLAAARTIFEGERTDMAIAIEEGARVSDGKLFVRQIDYFRSEVFLRQGDALVRLDTPGDASVQLSGGQLLVELKSDWQAGGRRFVQGSLLAADLAGYLAGQRDFSLLFTPTSASFLEQVTPTRDAILLTVLENVRSRLLEVRQVNGEWRQRQVKAPAFGQFSVRALDAADSNDYILTVNDFLAPTATYLGQAGSDRRVKLKSMHSYFAAAPYKVEQSWATSKDGARVPYFVVINKAARLDGRNPTVLNAYGGFGIAMKPRYLSVVGDAWLRQGGVFVLANIRGGGEFGPQWHTAAIKENRQRAFDDVIAVAEDLVRRKITSPRHLGITGRSNGGLLTAAALTQRPDLFHAAVCEVPLLDMKRYSHLLAGASWIGEYGDPDDPQQWAYIGKYSPYQNVFKDRHYPRVLFTSSTSDDRVHPGHARKMAAKMMEQGHAVLYWENTEGGHAGAVTLDQEARMFAMNYSFLLQQLR